MAEAPPPGAKESPWLLEALAAEGPVCFRDPEFDSDPEFDWDPETDSNPESWGFGWLTGPDTCSNSSSSRASGPFDAGSNTQSIRISLIRISLIRTVSQRHFQVKFRSGRSISFNHFIV
jgi:hypothetical protein